MKHLISKVIGIMVSIGMMLNFVPGLTVFADDVDTAVQNVIDLIEDLPEIEDITIADFNDISLVVDEYEKLDDDQKDQVTNLDKLDAILDYVIESFDNAYFVTMMIEEMDEVEYTEDCFWELVSIRNYYEDLTEFEQSLVTNIDKLEAAELAYDQAAADWFTEIVNRLPSVEDYDIDNDEHMDLMSDAYDAWDSLNDDQFDLVDKEVRDHYYAIYYATMDQILMQAVDTALMLLDKYENVLSDERAQDLRKAVDDCMNVINDADHVEDDYYDPAEFIFRVIVEADYELESIYTVTEGQDSTWKTGATTGLVFRIVQEGLADGAYKSFESAGSKIEMDGEAVDPGNFTYEEGSLIITLKPEYLNTLDEGTHTLTVSFDSDIKVELKFTIEGEAPSPSGGGSGGTTPIPATGESVSTAAIAGVVIILLAGVALGAAKKIKKSEGS